MWRLNVNALLCKHEITATSLLQYKLDASPQVCVDCLSKAARRCSRCSKSIMAGNVVFIPNTTPQYLLAAPLLECSSINEYCLGCSIYCEEVPNMVLELSNVGSDVVSFYSELNKHDNSMRYFKPIAPKTTVAISEYLKTCGYISILSQSEIVASVNETVTIIYRDLYQSDIYKSIRYSKTTNDREPHSSVGGIVFKRRIDRYSVTQQDFNITDINSFEFIAKFCAGIN